MRMFFALLAIVLSLGLNAQINPVKWSFDAQKLSDDTFELVLTADIMEKWVMYSQFLESDEGPIATRFEFEPNSNYQLIEGVVEDGHMKEAYDNLFEMQVKKLSGVVHFRQKIKLFNQFDKVKGVLTYMTCDNERCLPPRDVEFEINLTE